MLETATNVWLTNVQRIPLALMNNGATLVLAFQRLRKLNKLIAERPPPPTVTPRIARGYPFVLLACIS